MIFFDKVEQLGRTDNFLIEILHFHDGTVTGNPGRSHCYTKIIALRHENRVQRGDAEGQLYLCVLVGALCELKLFAEWQIFP
jgi:hypothetical protein